MAGAALRGPAWRRRRVFPACRSRRYRGKPPLFPAAGGAATEWNAVMATAMLAMIPPALVVILMQRWFVKGLVETEK